MPDGSDRFDLWRLPTLIGNVPSTEGEQQYHLDAGGSSQEDWSQGTNFLINFGAVHSEIDELHLRPPMNSTRPGWIDAA